MAGCSGRRPGSCSPSSWQGFRGAQGQLSWQVAMPCGGESWGGMGGQGNWTQSSHSPHPCPFPVLGAGPKPLGPGLIPGHLHSLYPNLLSRAGRQRPSEKFLNRQMD